MAKPLAIDLARSARARQIAVRFRRGIPAWALAVGCGNGRPARWRRLEAPLRADDAPQSEPALPPHHSGEFSAFGRSVAADDPELWSGSELLFRFHLHGFSELEAFAHSGDAGDEAGAAFWAAVIETWLTRHARPGGPAWHPYPTSGRLIAWSLAVSRVEAWPEPLRERMLSELWRQARYLRRAVEHDIGGNHVLHNATALCFAGSLFPDSKLLGAGAALLQREVAAQFLDDGAHEELSTSYQRRALIWLENARALLAEWQQAPWLDEAISKGWAWLAALSGPDRELPMLNDAWAMPTLEGPVAHPPITTLADSGLTVLRDGRDQLLFRAGPLGPRHLPAHVHADALSVGLWWQGEELICDPGTYTYSGPERDRLRGTGAHSTVEVDGENQCLFWGDFRASLLPRVIADPPRTGRTHTVLRARHDGYRRLRDPVVHHRLVVWLPRRGLVVVDWLECGRAHDVASALPTPPDSAVDTGRLGPLEVAALGPLSAAHWAAAEYAPYLGSKVAARKLLISGRVGPGEPFGWSLLVPGSARAALMPHALEISMEKAQITVPLTAATSTI